MQYGKIENYKIVGTCLMQTEDFPDEIPDEAVLFDFYIDGTLYPATEYAGKIPTVTGNGVTWADDISALKTEKQNEITTGFNSALDEGHFLSSVLGIEVDCRRNSLKNDYQNAQGLLSYMMRNKIEYEGYVGVSETAPATQEQVQSLIYEMEDHVAALYAKKWDLEAQIEAATTADEVAEISWSWTQS